MKNLPNISVVVTFLLLIGLQTAVAEDGPAGWRRDGSGRYPEATPPLTWSRIAKGVKELSAQAGKSKDDEPPAKDGAGFDGVIRSWLVLGPLPLAEDAKADEALAGAESLSPDADQEAGGMKWRAVTLETGVMDLCSLLKVEPDKKGFAAYAHTYIHSPVDQAIGYNFMVQGQGLSRVWFNGQQVYVSKVLDVGQGVRIVLQLKKGWNRLLVLNAKTMNTRKSWWISGSLYGDKGADYESQGIVWMTPIPSPGASSPVMAGDRIFFTAETGCVYCVSKADGKILWVRSLTYHDFATDEERKASPEAFVELDAAAARLKELDKADAVMPYKPPSAEKDTRFILEGMIQKGMAKVAKDRYNSASSYGCEAGYTACAPITDGKHVYALFGTGILACYDLDGNRKWARLLKHTMVEHGYTSSPLMVDGKLVVYHDEFTVLDPQTGEVLVARPHFFPGNTTKVDWYNHFHGTGCVLPAGNEKVVHYLNGEFVRVSDGKSLPIPAATLKSLKPDRFTDNSANRCSTPVVEGGVAYKITNDSGGVAAFKLPPVRDDALEPEILREVPFNTDKFPYYYKPLFCASPLLHEGLLYCVNDFGHLTVVDMAKGEILYQRQLDLEVFMPYTGWRLLKGGACASPTLAGKYIYVWGNQGTCIVMEPGRTFKQVARNRLEKFNPAWPAHQEATTTEPVFEGGRMYYRGDCTLYCIGPKGNGCESSVKNGVSSLAPYGPWPPVP